MRSANSLRTYLLLLLLRKTELKRRRYGADQTASYSRHISFKEKV